MRKRNLILSIISIFLAFALSSFAADFKGTWIVDGTYDIKAKFKKIKKESTNSFTGKQVVINANKTVTIDIGTYNFAGTWKKAGAKKLYFTLDKNKIRSQAQKYINDNYGSYLDNTELEISIKNYQIITTMQTDGSIKGSGTITGKCKVIYKLGPIEKDIGTANFSGALNFTGVKQ